jgi:hypothetical protein
MSTSVEAVALDYLKRGWSVIPIIARDKRPAVPWLAYQTQRASPEEVKRWFARHPASNLGIVTGEISGLVVLDVDPRHGGDLSLAALLRDHGPLPQTVEAFSGGGGRHLYFAHPGGVVRNQVGLAAGIDLRGDGGCVVAPPSLHPSGRFYSWRRAHAPHERALAPLPGWLLQAATAAATRHGHDLEYWRTLIKEGVPQGQRNNTIASLSGHLLWHGVDREVVAELMLSWNRVRCRPPLPDDEVLRTVQSIARLHARHGQGTAPE